MARRRNGRKTAILALLLFEPVAAPLPAADSLSAAGPTSAATSLEPSTAAAAAATARQRPLVVPREALPLRTSGRFVVDAAGRHMQLACVNWYGAHQPQMVMNGLDTQPVAHIAEAIARLGFNCVRLPFSLDLVFSEEAIIPDASIALRANPELRGRSPLQVFDATVEALTAFGLVVFLNQHVSSSSWCCSGSDGEGFWYTDRYPQHAWLEGLGQMAGRYRHNPWVAGFDLRNEVRPVGLAIPTWGTGNPKTDWDLAAVQGAKRVLAEKPDMLIAVSGIMYGIRLAEVRSKPIHALEPMLRNRTVYSSHYYYGWSFDLVARDYLLLQHGNLLFFAVWLGLLLAADEYSDRCGGRAALHKYTSLEDDLRESRGLRSSFRGCWAVVVAAVLLALEFICLVIGKCLELQCGHIGIVSPPAFAEIADKVLKISYVPWVWILSAYTLVVAVWGNESLQRSAIRDDTLDEDGRCAAEKLYMGPGDGEAAVEIPCTASTSDVSSSDERGRRVHAAVMVLGKRFCGPHATRRLVRPLRTHRRLTALGTLLFLSVVWLLDVHLRSYETFAKDLDVCWGFLLRGEGVEPAPVWLSEFGTEELDLYWFHLMRFMRENEVDFAYWSINGEKEFGRREAYGILGVDSVKLQNPHQVHMLQRTMIKRPPLSSTNSTFFARSPTGA